MRRTDSPVCLVTPGTIFFGWGLADAGNAAGGGGGPVRVLATLAAVTATAALAMGAEKESSGGVWAVGARRSAPGICEMSTPEVVGARF
jgi:hypothetical protein